MLTRTFREAGVAPGTASGALVQAREAGVAGTRGCPSSLNLLASRATSLGRLRLPPHPPEAGGALAALLRRDGSRGGDVLRFGARYGSSDSLPMGTPGYRPRPRNAAG